MNLFEALGQQEPLHLAAVGGGGKTTTIFQLARQVKGPAWVTTTTHLGTDQIALADRHFILHPQREWDPTPFLDQKVTLLTGKVTPDDRVKGPDPEILQKLAAEACRLGVSLLVEADGARSHPIKAPADHEPVIPAWVDTVIVLAGLSVLGKPLTVEWVHRPERFSQLSGIKSGKPVTLTGILRMMTDPLGGLKGITPGMRKIALFNQADQASLSREEESELEVLLDRYDLVLVASLGHDPDHVRTFSRN
jgi:molybdenum cofactor cytidylyltransferase